MIRPDLLCMFLLLCVATPWILRAVFGLSHTVTIKETFANCGILLFCTLMLWLCGTYGKMLDTEIINGYITNKEHHRVSCEHAYPCNCRQVCTSSGKYESCSTVCDTCYLHPYDVSWYAHSTVGDFYISRVDSQGLVEPPRYTAVQVGEPASVTETYENYIKAAPDSLFNQAKYDIAKYSYPDYPTPYDYYRINRVLNNNGVFPAFAQQLNDHLNIGLRQLSSQKQVNVIVVLTLADRGFADALKIHWMGGKKNDVVVVFGVDKTSIKWVDVFSWARDDIFNVQLRDDLTKAPLDANIVSNMIITHIGVNFRRKEMKDYKYLLDDFDPPMWLVITLLIIGIGGSIAGTLFAHRSDYFNENLWRRY